MDKVFCTDESCSKFNYCDLAFKNYTHKKIENLCTFSSRQKCYEKKKALSLDERIDAIEREQIELKREQIELKRKQAEHDRRIAAIERQRDIDLLKKHTGMKTVVSHD
jgi:hypothetical protein